MIWRFSTIFLSILRPACRSIATILKLDASNRTHYTDTSSRRKYQCQVDKILESHQITNRHDVNMFKERSVKFGMACLKFHGIIFHDPGPCMSWGDTTVYTNSMKFHAGHAKFYRWFFEHTYMMSANDLKAF